MTDAALFVVIYDIIYDILPCRSEETNAGEKKKKKEREAEKTLSLILPVVPSSFFMLIAYSPTTRTQLHTVAQKGFLVCFVFVLVCLFLMLTTLIHESPPSFYGICIHKGRPETLPSAVILSAVIFICSSFT